MQVDRARGIRQRQIDRGSTGVATDVGEALLGGPQQDHLLGTTERHRVSTHLQVRLHSPALPERVCQAFERLDKGPRLKMTGAEFGHDESGLVEVLRGGLLDEGQSSASRIDVTPTERRFCCPRQGQDRREPLREGVVDLPGQPLPLLGHSSISFCGSEFGLSRVERIDGLGSPRGFVDHPGGEDPEEDREGNRDHGRHQDGNQVVGRATSAPQPRRRGGCHSGDRRDDRCWLGQHDPQVREQHEEEQPRLGVRVEHMDGDQRRPGDREVGPALPRLVQESGGGPHGIRNRHDHQQACGGDVPTAPGGLDEGDDQRDDPEDGEGEVPPLQLRAPEALQPCPRVVGHGHIMSCRACTN